MVILSYLDPQIAQVKILKIPEVYLFKTWAQKVGTWVTIHGPNRVALKSQVTSRMAPVVSSRNANAATARGGIPG